MGREVRRVPIDFDWPIGTDWIGFRSPYSRYSRPCAECQRTGYSREAKRFHDQWYGNVEFDPVTYGSEPLAATHPAIRAIAECNVDGSPDYYNLPQLGRDRAIAEEIARLHGYWRTQWGHQLKQADVDALVAAERLHDMTHIWTAGEGWKPQVPAPVVTPAMVNDWGMRGMGHDSINSWICIRARCEREGVPTTCSACAGSGTIWETAWHKYLDEQWKPIPPPEGPGWQLWQTVSDGAPVSPVFAESEELVAWMVKEAGYTEEGSRAFVRAGWAPSMVGIGGEIMSGVEAAAVMETEANNGRNVAVEQ